MSFTAKAYYKRGHGENPVLLRTGEDVDSLVDALLVEPFSNSMANLYIVERPRVNGFPDHEFGVAVDAEDGVGSLCYLGEGESWNSLGDRSTREEVVYFYMGSDREFPIDSVVGLDRVRQAAKEFLASGGQRPTCVQWQPHRTASTTRASEAS
jgi:hypothetical protein